MISKLPKTKLRSNLKSRVGSSYMAQTQSVVRYLDNFAKAGIIINIRDIKQTSMGFLKTRSTILGPQRFWGSGENSYLFSGSWGALVIILGELGSKLIIWGYREPCQKCKKK